jgi:hypothetical protein
MDIANETYKDQYGRCNRRLADLFDLRDVGVPYRDPRKMKPDELAHYGVEQEDIVRVKKYFSQAAGVHLSPEEITECEKGLGKWLRAEINESPEWKDAVYTFFQTCYHLKDWIKNDPNAPGQKDVEYFVSSSSSLSICADICNGSKHLKLTRSRSGGNPKVRGYEATFQPIDIEERRKCYTKIKIEIDGQSFDAFDLAQKCMDKWDAFLGY